MTAAQVAQVWALVIESQMTVDTAEPSDAHAMNKAQEDVRSNARTYRSAQIPSVITQLVHLEEAAGQFQTLHEISLESPESAAVILDNLTPSFREFRERAHISAVRCEEFAKEAESRLAVLADRTHAEIKKISGDDGRIAAKSKELEEMQEVVRKDLEALISASHKVGSGARKILDTIVKIFKETAQKKEGDDTKKKDKPSSGEASPQSSEDVHKGIEDISSGSISAALQKLRRDREKVVAICMELAELRSGLAAAKQVDSECDAYLRSVRDLTRPAKELAGAWEQLVASLSATLEEQAKKDDSGTGLATEISWSVIKWQSLQNQTKRLRTELAGS
ncbi:hypothetical protein ABZ703_28710 [Streptomyces massasporeus]|uniref:hypothetical protein n=1 Tax=Streptomyces massasporeus TaxID=67324 RepID=UPI0033C439FF